MSCGCKKRAERLAARKKSLTVDAAYANRQLEKFGPARWDGKPKAEEAKSA